MLKSLVEHYIRAPEHRGKYRALRLMMNGCSGKMVRSKFGPLMICRPKDLTNFLCITGQPKMGYEDVYAEISGIQSGMAFLDVGANAGLFSLVAAQALKGSGPVIAVEPSLNTFFNLIGNAKVNAVREFFPFHLALGNTTELAKFAEGPDSHTGVGHLSTEGDKTVLMLESERFISIIDPLLINREVMIKIDVEGAEALIIQSMFKFLKRTSVTKVIVEIDRDYLNRFGNSPNDIYERMASAGFRPRVGEGGSHYNEVFSR